MIAPEIIQNIKAKMDILDIAKRYLTLTKTGKEYSCKCPFHDEKTPSFYISPVKQIFKCFGCGVSGNAIDFIIKKKNVTFIDAITEIAEIYHIDIGERLPPKQKPIYSNKPIKQSHTDWFAQRGISPETIRRAGITYSTEWMPKAKQETDVICFNYFRDGELINVKYRGENKDFKLSKGAELIFYNLDAIKDAKTVIITEGEMDCLSLMECGVKTVVSVPNGAVAGNQRLEYLDNCYDYFTNVSQVILFVDNDEAGNMLREELARRLGRERCYTIVYPDGCKDANDILLQHGKEAVLDAIKYAKEYPIDGILTMSDMIEDVSNYYLNGYPAGVRVGINGFDDLISFMGGQITTITGIPGSGKSEVIDWIMANATLNHGWSWGVCSFENQPSALHVTKLMEKLSGKSFLPRRYKEEQLTDDEFHTTAGIIQDYFNFININQVDVTLDGILNKAKELIHRKGINGLLIDPWNYIEHKIAPTQTETQYISECLTKIKAFALSNNIHIFLVAHPTKLRKLDNGLYEVPTMYSISGSAHFFNKTDNGISIWRNFVTNEVDIYIQKIRYSWLGKIGLVSFNYNTFTRQYQLINK